MSLKAAPYSQDDFSLHFGVLASLFLHIVFLWTLMQLPEKVHFDTQPEIIDVSIEPPKILQNNQKQLVSPSQQSENIPPQQTNRESENDSQVIKEQIKRGIENAGPSVGKQAEKQAPQPQIKSQEQKPAKPQKEISKPVKESESTDPLPKVSDLKLDDNTMIHEFSARKPSRMQGAPAKPFSRPQGSGAMFVGLNGSSDYIPNLPDGDITLLNAKANHYAVFVRRVAIQVFSRIRSLGWETLSPNDVRQIANDTIIEAVMSPKGDLLKVSLVNSSQSKLFDGLIVQAAKMGTRDPNPPEGAKADDGNIHFIFKSRSWSEFGPGPGGIPSERRWILLETGLE